MLLPDFMKLTALGALYKKNPTEFFCVCDWLLSLSIQSSRFSHIEAGIRMPYLVKAEYSIMCRYQVLFIHLATDGHLGSFYNF